jgi:hypothetical protein
MLYKIIECFDVRELERIVNQKMAEEGWLPLGGIALTPVAGNTERVMFYQALSKKAAELSLLNQL